MSQYGQYTSVSPAEVGLMTGMIGAGIGYTLAPRKYNLEQLLTQAPDVFEKSVPKKYLNKATDAQKAAHKSITDARKAIVLGIIGGVIGALSKIIFFGDRTA